MRRILALALALLAAPAVAQQPNFPAGPSSQSSLALIAPTPSSATENNNRIATTAWVNSFVNAGLPLASGKIWIGSVGGIATAQTPSGDLTVSNAGVFTFGTVNANVGSFGSATQCATVTVNAKGLITAASAATCTPAIGSVTGLGTGVATAAAAATNTNGGLLSGTTASVAAGAIHVGAGSGTAPTGVNITGLVLGNGTSNPSAYAGATSCTNQFMTGLSSTGASTCTTDTLASAQHANQGTTTTVLHGNAAGNPSWGAVALSTDISGFGSGVAAAAANATNANGGFPVYNTGTWTPTITTSGTVGTPAYSVQVGSYEQIGRLVVARFNVQLSGWTGSPTGNVSIAGLPFTSTSTANEFGTCNISQFLVTGLAANNFGVHASVSTGVTTALLQQQGNTGNSAVTAAQYGTTGVVIGACFYRT